MMTFPQLPSRSWNLRRTSGTRKALVDALVLAVNEAGNRGFAKWFDNLDNVLELAEPWVDRDILRAHILKDGDQPPGTKFALAFVRGDGLIDPERWYVLPSATAGAIPVCTVAIALDRGAHLVLKDGWEAFYKMVLSQLRSVGITAQPGRRRRS